MTARGRRVDAHQKARLDELPVEHEVLDHHRADGKDPLAGVSRAAREPSGRDALGEPGRTRVGHAILDMDGPSVGQNERAGLCRVVGPQGAIDLVVHRLRDEASGVRRIHAPCQAQLADGKRGPVRRRARLRRGGRDASRRRRIGGVDAAVDRSRPGIVDVARRTVVARGKEAGGVGDGGVRGRRRAMALRTAEGERRRDEQGAPHWPFTDQEQR